MPEYESYMDMICHINQYQIILCELLYLSFDKQAISINTFISKFIET